jgi:hypothetical protein
MKSAGLVSGKTSLSFHSWTIDTGSLVESNVEIWQEIAIALGKGKVEAAAMALRHHLENVARHLADQLGATPQFRAHGNYDLGALMPSVLKRMRELCGKAADAAQSWGKNVEREVATTRKTALSTSNAAPPLMINRVDLTEVSKCIEKTLRASDCAIINVLKDTF